VIDVKRLRQDPEGCRAALARRLDPKVDATVDRVLALDRRRRELLVRAEALKASRNAQSDEVARRKQSGADATALLAELKASGDEVKALDAQVREVDAELEGAWGPFAVPDAWFAEVFAAVEAEVFVAVRDLAV